MSKDWIGNANSIFKIISASNHTDGDRADNDYYATEPKATQLLLDNEKFSDTVWEPACGGGYMAEVLKKNGYRVIATDLIYRGYGVEKSFDFLEETFDNFNGDIVTNPPYNKALQFVQRALDNVKTGHKVAMFLKLTFLEGKSRKQFFLDNPPKIVYVSSSRLICAKNGDFESINGSAVAYAWFVWEKGFSGDPIIKWIN